MDDIENPALEDEEEDERRPRAILFLLVAIVLLIICALLSYFVLLPLLQGTLAPTATPTATPLSGGQAEIASATPTDTAEPTDTATPTATPTSEEEGSVTPTVTRTPLPAVPTSLPSPTPLAGAIPLNAQLTVLSGNVYLLRSGSTQFVLISGTHTVSVGDIIRTGANGLVLLSFGGNTEATLFGNTQVQISRLEQNTSGQTLISLSQSIGKMQNRVNLGAGSLYLVQTPPGTGGTGTGSFTTEVFYDGHLGLSAGQLEQAIQANCAFSGPFLNLTCLAPLGQVTSNYLAENGAIPVTFVHVEDGLLTVTPQPGQQLTMRAEVFFDVNGGQAILVTEWVLITPGVGGEGNGGGTNCGDGVCDPYEGEDSLTCPEDCP